MPTCPHCGGRGTAAVLLSMGDGSSLIDTARRCGTCSGAGDISERLAGWIAAGKRHRDARLGKWIGQAEAARMIGINPRHLNEMEQGRADPAMLDGRTYEGKQQ